MTRSTTSTTLLLRLPPALVANPNLNPKPNPNLSLTLTLTTTSGHACDRVFRGGRRVLRRHPVDAVEQVLALPG